MKNFSTLLDTLKKPFLILFLASAPLFIVSCDDDDDDMSQSTDTILDVASRTPELSTFVTAFNASSVDYLVSGDGPYTIFAPSNDAFAKLDEETLNNIIATPSLLNSLLQYHATGGKVSSTDLTDGSIPSALSGQNIEVSVAGGVTLNGSSSVTTADLDASNGVIHIIDEVLIPENYYAQTIVQIAASDPNFSILVSALAKPELSDLLAAANDPTSDLTVFAPTNDAFEAVLDALDKESIDDIPVELLREIVSYHILGSSVESSELANGDVETLLPGESITVDLTDGVKINNSNVTAADIKAVNGVIHVLDGVLLPSFVATAVGNVGEVVLFEKDFTILAAALRKAELLDAVSTTEDITVFAPDNAAFVAAGITSLDGLEKEDLSPVLLYHVLGARVKSDQLPADGMATTLNGENIYLGYLFNGVLINGLTNIKAVDIEKSNGVIHVIDRTLVPPAPNVVEIALALADQGDDSEFTVLTSLLASDAYADITQAIIDAENITVFAPTDAAFEDIADVVAGLTEEQIRTVLTYHAVGARVFSSDLVEGQIIPMLNGQTLKVQSLAGPVLLRDQAGQDAEVIEVNVHGSNGVIHVVNKVLIPNL